MHKHKTSKHWTNNTLPAPYIHKWVLWRFILQEQCVDEHPWGVMEAIHTAHSIPSQHTMALK